MTHIKTRGDTSGAWSAANPVLMADEIGIETDTDRTKQGDGITAWNSLPYASAPFNNAALTGIPTAPTAAGGTNTTQIATTQFVQATLAPKANTASPAFTGDPTAPTPAPGDNDFSIATTAFVQAALSSALSTAVAAAILAAHPVGSIHTTVSPINPGAALGGTWVAWGAGKVPIGVDTGDPDFATVEETGGVKTHSHNLDTTTSGARIRVGVDTGLWVTPKTLSSRAHTKATAVASPSTISSSSTSGIAIEGQSDVQSNVQPYITCYFWKRTA